MAHGTVSLKLRPIKLGFLVDLNDRVGLLEAIEINSFLWGGQFNPIIPVFGRRPKVWGNEPTRGTSPGEIVAGYIDNFDPDLIVPVGKCRGMTFDNSAVEVANVAEIMSDIEKGGTPRYGIGLFEILRYFIDKELKFLRRNPIHVCFPDIGIRYRPFLASVFGVLSENVSKLLKDMNFDEVLGIKRPRTSIRDYHKLLASSKLFPRRFSSLYLDHFNTTSWGNECVFVLDARENLDVIDYWNLRAIGWNVLPVPKQAWVSDEVRQLVADFIESNFYPINPTVYNETTILKSRHTDETELRNILKSLNVPKPKDKKQFKYVTQPWYPRIWDEWAKEHDHVTCCQLDAGTIEHDLAGPEDDLRIKTHDPKFAKRFSNHNEPRFANEIAFSWYVDTEDITAQVLPKGNKDLARAAGLVGIAEWRFSNRGIVYLSRHTESSIFLTMPNAQSIFVEWLGLKGWKTELSSPGRIGKQILKQLGGTFGISILAEEGLIKLLEKMAEDKTISKEQFWAEMQKITNEREFPIDPNRFLKNLLKANMFRLGVELQCPTCTQHSWYSIKELDYQLRCSKCSDEFEIPSDKPNELRWSYRTHGPFNLPFRAYGVYSVLLTLKFFAKPMTNPTTPILSFTASKGSRRLEADLGLLLRESKFGQSKTHLIFAECKSYNHFEKADIDRMRFIGSEFPGAILVFSTLRKSLTEKEKRMMRPLVNQGRRFWKAEHPFNPVLILTGTELFSHHEPPYCWRDLNGMYKRFADANYLLRDLIQLCDATQQLYLDMKSRFDWLRDRYSKRRKQKTRKRAIAKGERRESIGPVFMRRVASDTTM